jgi:hypothetical protein
LIGKDLIFPENRVLAMVKTNLDAHPRSLSFRVPPKAEEAPIQWLGRSDLTADDLVRVPGKGLHPAVLNAMEFLKRALYDQLNCGWRELSEMADKEGIAEITLRRARGELKLLKKQEGRQFLWELPDDLWREMAALNDGRRGAWPKAEYDAEGE